jgi:arylsulfatase A-like enzyme
MQNFLPKRLLNLTLLTFLLVSMAGSSQANEPIAFSTHELAKKKPNIIYIMLDDAGYADFGAFGSTDIQTSTFDQMCREGMRFNHHYSGSAVCAPTRCVLMTGLHTGHCKRRDNKTTALQNELSHKGLVFLDKNDVTVAAAMQAAGYTTAGIGKWGLGNADTPGTPDNQGFDHFFGYLDQVHAHNHYTDWLWKDGKRMEIPGNADGAETTYVHDLFEQETLDFVRNNANEDKPFFLYLPYTLPHGKYVIPHETNAYKIYAEKAWQPQVKQYAAMVTRADETVGKLLALLKELKIDDDTIVFYTSDNGPNAPFAKALKSGQPFRGVKRQLTEGGLRAAMVARWPGKIPSGASSDFAWSMVDVFPTCCDLAGVEKSSVLKDQKLDGVSVVPTLMGQVQEPIDSIYFEIHHPFQQAVRMDQWKGFRTGTKEALKLFDVNEDPGESTDLAAQHENIVKQIEAIMDKEHVNSKFYPTIEKAKPNKKKRKKNPKETNGKVS